MNAGIEERLFVLEAREAYRDITARYAWCATQGQADAIVTLFTEDGTFEKLFDGGRRAIAGRQAVLTHMRSSLAPGKLTPLIHNHIIDVTPDGISATCILEAPANAERPGGTLALYRDKLRQVDGVWLFSERRVFLMRPTNELMSNQA